MKIEAGKYYRLRNREKVLILSVGEATSTNPRPIVGKYETATVYWLPTGRHYEDLDSEYDIVAEWR